MQKEVVGIVEELEKKTPDVLAIRGNKNSIQLELTDLLLALARKYRLKYSIPKAAKPRDILGALGAKAIGEQRVAATAKDGYSQLERKIAQLHSYLDTSVSVEQVKSVARETILLAWALEGWAIIHGTRRQTVEGVPPSTGGTAAALNFDGPWVVRAYDQLYGYRIDVTLELLDDAVDSYSENQDRILDRRRQSEAVDLNYPHANVDEWLFNWPWS